MHQMKLAGQYTQAERESGPRRASRRDLRGIRLDDGNKLCRVHVVRHHRPDQNTADTSTPIANVASSEATKARGSARRTLPRSGFRPNPIRIGM